MAGQQEQDMEVDKPKPKPVSYKFKINEMNGVAQHNPAQPYQWHGPASDAREGGVIKNYATSSFSHCRTNMDIDSMKPFIYVRKAYIEIYERIKAKVKAVRDKRKQGTNVHRRALIHICGTPMIGKTMFLYYVMARLSEEVALEIPGFVIVGVIPSKRNTARYVSVCRLVKGELSFEKKSSDSLRLKSDDVNEKYPGFIFLIDNAKSDDPAINVEADTIVFASPKLVGATMDTKVNIVTLYMPVWKRHEIEDLVAKLPDTLPSGEEFTDYEDMKADLDRLMHFFGGTLGNMVHYNREQRAFALNAKADRLLKHSVFNRLITAGEKTKVNTKYASLIEVMTDANYNAVGTMYVSRYFMDMLLKKTGHGSTAFVQHFWDAGSAHAPVAYGNWYEDVLGYFLDKNSSLEMKWIEHKQDKCLHNLPPSQLLEKKMVLEFEEDAFHQDNNQSKCLQIRRLVRMWKNSPSIDFYTIQKRESAADRVGDDVQAALEGKADIDHNVDDGHAAGYDVLILQSTVAKGHPMDFAVIANFLVQLEQEVVANIKKGTAADNHMKNSLLSGSVSLWLCYLQPRLNVEFSAPGQEELMLGNMNTRSSGKNYNLEKLLRDAIRSKLQVIYGVGDPIKQICQEESGDANVMEHLPYDDDGLFDDDGEASNLEDIPVLESDEQATRFKQMRSRISAATKRDG